MILLIILIIIIIIFINLSKNISKENFRGSAMRSCRNFQFNSKGDQITAMCLDQNSNWIQTVAPKCHSNSYKNINGKLYCE
jgi:hypothetical protein